MNLSELRSEVDTLLGRTDVTSSQIDSSINATIRRVSSVADLPDQEKASVLTLDANLSAAVPTDLIELVTMSHNDFQLKLVDVATFQYIQKTGSQIKYFTRIRDKYHFRPAGENMNVNLTYYAPFAPLATDTDSNPLTTKYPDLILYGTAARLCSFFDDAREDRFKNLYNEIAEEIKMRRDDERRASPSQQTINPAYPVP